MFNLHLQALYRKYRNFTMVPKPVFVGNLRLVQEHSASIGAVVECGVWRGGMSAAIAEVMGPEREYFLFDSFEGLPPAKDIDGPAALDWQRDTASPTYFDNCHADIAEARRAMAMSGAQNVRIVKGWFEDTVSSLPREMSIALLRLDGDWYESTMQCLTYLYPRVVDGGLIIIDDYYAWDGCARAVHDFLSSTNSVCRLLQSADGICYMIKKIPRGQTGKAQDT